MEHWQFIEVEKDQKTDSLQSLHEEDGAYLSLPREYAIPTQVSPWREGVIASSSAYMVELGN